ncbi:MAG: FadR/GntR family transcriptional regulator [Bacillota bacterium]
MVSVNESPKYEPILRSFMELIKTGELKPGDSLPPERTLAQKLNASRATIREGLRILEFYGLIESRQGSGRRVKAIQDNERQQPLLINPLLVLESQVINDFLEFRFIVEPETTKLAAMRRTDKDLESMTEILEEVRVCNLTDEGGITEDALFHLAIAEATQNHIFKDVTTIHFSLLKRIRRGILWDHENRMVSFAEHMNIFEAIRDRQPERAYALALEHLRGIKQRLASP